MSAGDAGARLYVVLGERIASARNSKGLSQAKLAAAVGVTRASIVNIECGRQRPPLHLIWHIALAVEVEPVSLIPRCADLETPTDAELLPQLVAQIQNAAHNDPTTQAIVTDFVRRMRNRFNDKAPTEHAHD